MILGITLYKGTTPESASIVPLAFPMVAGAGALTTVLSLRAKFYVEKYYCSDNYQYGYRLYST